MAKMEELVCKNCGNPFMKPVHRPRTFCSQECYRKSKDFRITSALFMGRGKPGPKKRA